jgi:hypothetical protein
MKTTGGGHTNLKAQAVNVRSKYMRRTCAALATFAVATLQAAAADSLPSYASTDETIQGSVSSINGRDLNLRDERGFVDHVVLHDGTVINPTGTQIESGQALTIHGHADGAVFRATEIDSYAVSYAPDPYPSYVDPFYGYGYGFDAGYGYGPYFGSSLFFGFGGGFGGRGFGDRGFGGRGFGDRGFGGRGFGGHGFSGGGSSARGFSGGGSGRGGARGR